jgi:hypothetical protein
MRDDWGGRTVRGSGELVEEDRDVSNISGVELAMPGTLYLVLFHATNLEFFNRLQRLDFVARKAKKTGKMVVWSTF